MLAAAALCALALAGCASRPAAPAGAGGGQTTAAAEASGSSGGLFGWFGRPASPLSTLYDNMSGAMRGTPVDVDMPSDNLVLVTVPLQNSFATGRAAVRPALGAVLNKLATELRQVPEAQLAVAGPADERGSALLAQDRAAATRDWLVSRGVPATRFARPGRHGEPAVEIRISLAGAPPR